MDDFDNEFFDNGYDENEANNEDQGFSHVCLKIFFFKKIEWFFNYFFISRWVLFGIVFCFWSIAASQCLSSRKMTV